MTNVINVTNVERVSLKLLMLRRRHMDVSSVESVSVHLLFWKNTNQYIWRDINKSDVVIAHQALPDAAI